MDSLLAELNAQENVQVNYSNSRNSRPSFTRGGSNSFARQKPQNYQHNTSNKVKSCVLCKTAGRPHVGHDVGGCWFISKFDRLELTRALQVVVDPDELEAAVEGEVNQAVSVGNVDDDGDGENELTVRRVSCQLSPFIHAFFKHFPCKILIDTGATSSMVSSAFVRRTGLKPVPTTHGAVQLDKSPVNVKGEIRFTVTFGPHTLVIEALITDTLDCSWWGTLWQS